MPSYLNNIYNFRKEIAKIPQKHFKFTIFYPPLISLRPKQIDTIIRKN